MIDYTYPSVYFAYLFFMLMAGLALFFFLRSYKDGYFDERGEEAKYQMLQDADEERKVS